MAIEEHENVAKKQVAMSTFCRQNKPYHGTILDLLNKLWIKENQNIWRKKRKTQPQLLDSYI